MFAELDKIDVVAKHPDGRVVYLLTEERSPADIDADGARSVVFAMARVRGIVLHDIRTREGGAPPGVVAMVFDHEPPEALAVALHAVGARRSEDGVETSALRDDEPADADALLDDAMHTWAGEVARREGLTFDLEGLVAYEAALAELDPPDDDPLTWWTRLFELCAVAGEVLRARSGGHWRWTDDDVGVVRCVWVGTGDVRMSVVHRAERLLRGDRDGGPSRLVELTGTLSTSHEGQPVLVLRRPHYGGGKVWSMPIADVELPEWLIEDVPRVFLARDLGMAVAISQGAPSEEELVAHLAAARGFLAQSPVELQDVEVDGGGRVVHVTGEYASERILDVAFLARLAQGFGGRFLVSVPAQYHLLATGEATAAAEVFRSATLGIHSAEDVTVAPLSPLEFEVDRSGTIVGVHAIGRRTTEPTASPEPDDGPGVDEGPVPPEDSPEPDVRPRPGFWRRLWRFLTGT